METTDDTHAGSAAGSDDERIGGQPIDGDGHYPFAGLSRYDEDVDALALPEGVWSDTSSMNHWAQTKRGVERDLDAGVLPERGLNTIIPELPRANHAQAAWIHPRTGTVYRTGKHNAVIDPERAEAAVDGYGSYPEAIADVTGRDQTTVESDLAEMSLDDYMDECLVESQRESVEDAGVGDDALFQIAGEDHSIINPQQPMEELVAELQARDYADKVFGEVTIDRDGGRGTLDAYIDGNHVESPVFADEREPVVVGIQLQWSFFDDWAFRVCGQGLDWHCTNHIHRLTDRETVRYAGDIERRVDWREMFSDVLDRLDEKTDQLARIIQAAADETLDFNDLPADLDAEFSDEEAAPWTALYAYLGLPNYLARHAGPRLRSQAGDAYEPDWWEIHSAATYAVSHHDQGDRTAGGSFEDHARVANDMLFNPARMEDRVVENYEADRRTDDQGTLAEEDGGTAEIRTAFEDTREKQQRFEEWEAELKEMGVEV
jgi:hypothetical protein